MKKLFVMLIVLAAVVPVQANMLWNGNFNVGTLEGWWTWTETGNEPNQSVRVQNEFTYDSSYCLEVWTASDRTTKVGQSVNIGEGVPVVVSLLYDGFQWGGAGVSINYYDADWNYLNYAWAQIYSGNGSDTGWQLFNASSGEGVWTTPAGTQHLGLEIHQWGWATTYFENVVLTPEPTTMVMLGLGGLALIRRKKA